MNKGDLINAVSTKADITKAQATEAVNTIFDSIEGTLKTGDKASFIGFGTFSISKREARERRNPAKRATTKLATTHQVKFKAGKALKDSVN